MIKISTITVSILLTINAFADEYLPEVIYQLDDRFAHHVLVVEKSTHKLFLYENSSEVPKLLKTYQVATGKITGNKTIQGDKKTPEGIYRFQQFHSGQNLVEKYGKAGLIYGAGAFTMNYPNTIDRRKDKTGGGIWLHSTDDDTRVSKGLDSKGCVVATDADLKDISQYIDLQNTPIIVTQNLTFLRKATWLDNKKDLTDTLVTWANAWKDKDFNTYINQYSKDRFLSNTKGNYFGYSRYKKAVFARKDTPSINFNNISILNFKTYAVITMVQNYNSSVIQDVGKKTLYLQRDDQYNWKIVSEEWERLPANTNLAFTPKMRFFTEDSNQVANDSGSI